MGQGLLVDALDFAILRRLSPDGEARFWGARRLIDPRVSAREVGDAVGISETGARARLRALAERGYLRGWQAWPNPSLFGASLVSVEIPVTDTRQVAKLFDELPLVEGVTFARDLLDETDRKVRVHFVSDTPAGTSRRTALLRRLSPSGSLRGPLPYWIPPCGREPTALDWRILSALRRLPNEGLASLAREVGISLKTAANRYHLLADSRACWWTASPDSEEIPSALLAISVREPGDRASIAAEVAQRTETWMPVAADGLGQAPSEESLLVAGLVLIDTPTRVELAVRRILALPKVASVHRTFALGSVAITDWFDERIEERQPARPPQSRSNDGSHRPGAGSKRKRPAEGKPA